MNSVSIVFSWELPDDKIPAYMTPGDDDLSDLITKPAFKKCADWFKKVWIRMRPSSPASPQTIVS